MARWHLQISCPPVWEHCRNVSICPLTSCKVRVGHAQGIFSSSPPTHSRVHLKNFPDQSMCSPGAEAPPPRCLLPHVPLLPLCPSVALSHWRRSAHGARAMVTPPDPDGLWVTWKKNDAVIRKLSLRLPWDMARWSCLSGFINSGSLPERERCCVKLEAAWHVTNNDDYIPPHCVHVSGCYVARPHLCCTLWSGSVVRLFFFFF